MIDLFKARVTFFVKTWQKWVIDKKNRILFAVTFFSKGGRGAFYLNQPLRKAYARFWCVKIQPRHEMVHFECAGTVLRGFHWPCQSRTQNRCKMTRVSKRCTCAFFRYYNTQLERYEYPALELWQRQNWIQTALYLPRDKEEEKPINQKQNMARFHQD